MDLRLCNCVVTCSNSPGEGTACQMKLLGHLDTESRPILEALRELYEAQEEYNYVRSLYMCPRHTLIRTADRLQAAKANARDILDKLKE